MPAQLPVDAKGQNGINSVFAGKVVRLVTRNGCLLRFTFADGTEQDIAFVDENGKPMMGIPVLWFDGLRIKLGGPVRELLHRTKAGL
jgi:hypothetical protein